MPNTLLSLQCVCNENTAIPIPGIGNGSDRGNGTDLGNNTTDIIDRGGDNTTDGGAIDIGNGNLDEGEGSGGDSGGGSEGGIDMDGVCSPANIGPTQIQLQQSQYLTSCQHSNACGAGTCCYSQYCVCWPTEHLANGVGTCT